MDAFLGKVMVDFQSDTRHNLPSLSRVTVFQAGNTNFTLLKYPPRNQSIEKPRPRNFAYSTQLLLGLCIAN